MGGNLICKQGNYFETDVNESSGLTNTAKQNKNGVGEPENRYEHPYIIEHFQNSQSIYQLQFIRSVLSTGQLCELEI